MPNLGVQEGADQVSVGSGVAGGAVRDGVLIQDAVGQKNDPLAADVGEHGDLLK